MSKQKKNSKIKKLHFQKVIFKGPFFTYCHQIFDEVDSFYDWADRTPVIRRACAFFPSLTLKTA
jgi:hypothetical protein